METEFKSQIRQAGVVVIIPKGKIILLVEGFAVGPFETPENALAWAYNHNATIFTMKELFSPQLEMM